MIQKTSLLSLALLLFAGAAWLSAQDAPDSKTDDEFRGRLPAYFSQVVDETQKEKIYAVQKKYQSRVTALEDQIDAAKKQLDELQQQLDTLSDLRREEIAELLTPEQRTKIRKLQEAALLKRIEELRGAGEEETAP